MNPLTSDKLYRKCNPDQFEFETTADLEILEGLIGQSRAVEAVQFGIGIRSEGYNLYVLGPHGTGKHTAVRQFLEQKAANEPSPSDWCYVNNFASPHQSRAIRLPAGHGIILRRDIEHLVDEFHTSIPAAFDSEDYRTRKLGMEEEFNEKQEQFFRGVQQQAKKENFALIRTPNGLTFAPLKDGDVIKPDDFQKLPPEEQDRIEDKLTVLQNEMQTAIRKVQRLEREHHENLRKLNRETAQFAVEHFIDELRQNTAIKVTL